MQTYFKPRLNTSTHFKFIVFNKIKHKTTCSPEGDPLPLRGTASINPVINQEFNFRFCVPLPICVTLVVVKNLVCLFTRLEGLKIRVFRKAVLFPKNGFFLVISKRVELVSVYSNLYKFKKNFIRIMT